MPTELQDRRRRLAATFGLLLLVALTLSVPNARPTQAAGRAVALSKSVGVQNGETITVSWEGFVTGPAYIHQCETGATSWRFCSERTRLVGTTAADGTGSIEFPVWGNQGGQAIPGLNIPGFGNDPLSCVGNSCAIFVSECGFDLNAPRTASAAINLTGQGTNPTSTSTSSSSTSTSLPPTPGTIVKDPISGGGSSEPQLAIAEWENAAIREPYQIDVGYTITNSPTGADSFVNGENDFAIVNGPLSAEQLQRLTDAGKTFAYVPISLSALSISLGMTINGIPVEELQLSGATIAKAYNGTSSYFNEPIYTADNGGCRIPSTSSGPRQPLAIIRTDQSSANLIFTKWLDAVAAADWGREPSVLLPVDDSRLIGRSGSEAVATVIDIGAPDGSGVEADRLNSFKAGRLGYVDRSFAAEFGLTQVKIKNAAGEYLGPTDDAVLAAFTHAMSKGADGTYSTDFTAPVPGAYPLPSIGYAIVPTSLSETFTVGKAKSLAEYLQFVVSDQGQDLAVQAGLVRLPQALRDDAAAAIAKIPTVDPNATTTTTTTEPTSTTETTSTTADTFVDTFGDGGFQTASDVATDTGAVMTDAGSVGGEDTATDATTAAAADGAATIADPGTPTTTATLEAADPETAVPTQNIVASLLGGSSGMITLPALLGLGLLALAAGPTLRAWGARRAS